MSSSSSSTLHGPPSFTRAASATLSALAAVARDVHSPNKSLSTLASHAASVPEEAIAAALSRECRTRNETGVQVEEEDGGYKTSGWRKVTRSSVSDAEFSRLLLSNGSLSGTQWMRAALPPQTSREAAVGEDVQGRDEEVRRRRRQATATATTTTTTRGKTATAVIPRSSSTAAAGADASESESDEAEDPLLLHPSSSTTTGSTANAAVSSSYHILSTTVEATIVSVAGYAVALVEVADMLSLDGPGMRQEARKEGKDEQGVARQQQSPLHMSLSGPFPLQVDVFPTVNSEKGASSPYFVHVQGCWSEETDVESRSPSSSFSSTSSSSRQHALSSCVPLSLHIQSSCGSNSAYWSRDMPGAGREGASVGGLRCGDEERKGNDTTTSTPFASLTLLLHLREAIQHKESSGNINTPENTLRIVRRYLLPVVGEGHTLCVTLPPGTSASSPIARVQVALLGDAIGGLAGIVCPSHDARMRIIVPVQSQADEDSGMASRSAAVVASIEILPATATATSTGPSPLPRPIVLLLEPGNLAADWNGLSSTPLALLAGQGKTTSSSVPPSLLSCLSWICEAAQRQQNDKSPLTSSAAPALPSRSTVEQSSTSSSSSSSLPSGPILLSSRSLPRHIAVVMDGNGRWAQSRGEKRSAGHRAGVEAIHTLIRSCRRLRIPVLTLYAFSAQNWSRPPDEVRVLMTLLAEFVATDLQELCANGVRLLVNGDIARLPAPARNGLERMIAASRHNTALTLCLALSYGGREEIVGGVVAACRAAQAGLLDPDRLTPEAFRSFLPHPDLPDPDLLIRTSGELRVSNFLLWQIAYTELYVTPTLWPDFGEAELTQALLAFAGRERRFGKTGAQMQGQAQTSAGAGAEILAAAAEHVAKNADTLKNGRRKKMGKGRVQQEEEEEDDEEDEDVVLLSASSTSPSSSSSSSALSARRRAPGTSWCTVRCCGAYCTGVLAPPLRAVLVVFALIPILAVLAILGRTFVLGLSGATDGTGRLALTRTFAPGGAGGMESGSGSGSSSVADFQQQQQHLAGGNEGMGASNAAFGRHPISFTPAVSIGEIAEVAADGSSSGSSGGGGGGGAGSSRAQSPQEGAAGPTGGGTPWPWPAPRALATQ